MRSFIIMIFVVTPAWLFSAATRHMAVGQPMMQTGNDSEVSGKSPEKWMNRMASLNINDVWATVPDTFWHLPCTIGGPGKDIAYQSRQTHPAFVYFPKSFPWRPDSAEGKIFGILFTTPYMTSEKAENPWGYVITDISDPSSATRILDITENDTTWFPGPLCRPSDFRQDSIFWYHGSGDTTYYDTGHVAGADSVGLNKIARHLSDVTAACLPGSPPRILLGVRVTWELSNIEMSAVYFSTSDNLTDWSGWVQATHLGKWLSPAVMTNPEDATYRYVMYCPLETADRVAGITDTTTTHKFSAERWDTVWTYAGPVTISNRPKVFRPWHLSVMSYSPDQQLAIVTPTIGNLRLMESTNRGDTWICSDSVLLIIPAGSRWWSALYQTTGLRIERGNDVSLGLVFSGFRDSSAAQIWHIGFVEIPVLDR